MREELGNKLDAILKEIKSNKSSSTVTNPRYEMNDIQNMQSSGSKTNKSIGVHASYNENRDSENEDYLLQASKMRDLRHPARPFHRRETNLNETMVSEEDSEEEDYHNIENRICNNSLSIELENLFWHEVKFQFLRFLVYEDHITSAGSLD